MRKISAQILLPKSSLKRIHIVLEASQRCPQDDLTASLQRPSRVHDTQEVVTRSRRPRSVRTRTYSAYSV